MDKITELMVLYDIVSLSFPERYEDLIQEMTEKASRLLGVCRLALITSEGEKYKCLGSWGFHRENEIWEKIKEKKENCFLYPMFNGKPVWLYLEKMHPLTEGDKRLYTVFARRIEDIFERKRAEEHSRKRTEQIINQQSALLELARMNISNYDCALKRITEVDARTLGVEEVSVWFFNDEHTEIVCEDLYRLRKGIHKKGIIKRIKICNYQRYFTELEESHFIAIEDVSTDPRTVKFAAEILTPLGITSVLDIPIRLFGEVVGFLIHGHRGKKRKWTPEEEQFALSIADMISLVLENMKHKNAREGIAKRDEQLRLITDNMLDMICQVNAEGRIEYISPSCQNILGYRPEEMLQKSFLSFLHPDDRANVVNSWRLIVEKGQEFFSKKIPERIEFRHRHYDGSFVWLETVGNFLFDKNGCLSGVVYGLREIAERKMAEEKLRQNVDKLKEAVEGVIQAMSRTVEMRDPYTAGHQRRVAKLACAIAQEMKLNEDQIEGIRIASAIHDIGKIYVPAEILSKPGQINGIEFNLIKTHPNIGFDILKTIEFSWPIANIILQHHERRNASGYPFGLSGEEILIEARILAVADVVEAMASHRPYRPALGIEKALEEISRNNGILYDPEVTDACLRLFSRNGFAFEL